MRKIFSLGVALFFSGAVFAVEVGKPAPDFSGQGSDGKIYKLSDNKGKFVVLEWTNTGCPFVKKHYNSGNMQKLQETWTKKGVVWYSISSSAKGKEGYVTASEENAYLEKEKASPTAALLDAEGKIGKLYSAKCTPHMFVINPDGKIIYAGAIDDKRSTDVEDVPGAKNYVNAALEEATAGKKVTTPSTVAYGCSIKY